MNDIATLTLKIDSLEAKLAKVELDNLTKAGKETALMTDLLESGFKRLMAVLGPAALIAVVIQTIKHVTELQAQYVKLSEVAGTTAATISGFDEPARLAGVGLDSVANSIARLSREIGQARLGDQQAGGLLRALGINPDDGRDAAEHFVDLSKVLLTMKDQTVAAAVSQQFLGRGFSEMRPLMKEIVEQGGIHARVTKEEAEQAKHLDDSLVKLKSSMERHRMEIVNEIIPALNVWAEKLNVLMGAQDRLSLDSLQKERIALAKQYIDVKQQEAEAEKNGEISHLARSQLRALETKKILEQIDAIDALIKEENQRIQVGKDAAQAKTAAGGDAEARVKQLLNDKQHYEERVNLLKAFGQQYADEIKAANDLLQEAYKEAGVENLATQTRLIEAQAENNRRNLEQQRAYLEQQRALAFQQGDFGKVGETVGAIGQINAKIVADEAITQAQIRTLRAQTQRQIQDELGSTVVAENRQYQLRLKALEAYLQEYGDKVTNARELREKLDAQHQANLGSVSAQGALERMQFDESSLSQQASFLTGFFTSSTAAAAQHNKKMFELNKLAGEAQIIVSTTIGVMKAWEMGPILGPIMAGIVAAAGAINLRTLRATQFGGGGSAPSAGGSAASASAFPASGSGAPATTSPGTAPIEVHVHIDTMVGEQSWVDNMLIPAVQDAINNRDVELIDVNSRQAKNLAGVTA